jgi:hypothetical protein
LQIYAHEDLPQLCGCTPAGQGFPDAETLAKVENFRSRFAELQPGQLWLPESLSLATSNSKSLPQSLHEYS